MKFQIPEVEKLSEESKQLYDVVNEESDLAAVLIGTSYLDYSLASLLKRYFIESEIAQKLLEPPRGSLSTFASRYDIAYCLGLISKGLYRNLETIGQIRNAFAHRYLSLNLEAPEVSVLVEKLTFPRVSESITIDENGARQTSGLGFPQFSQSRDRFCLVLVLMVNSILMAGLATQRRSKHNDMW